MTITSTPMDRIGPRVEVLRFSAGEGERSGWYGADLTVHPAVGDPYKVAVAFHPASRVIDIDRDDYRGLTEHQANHLVLWAGAIVGGLCRREGVAC